MLSALFWKKVWVWVKHHWYIPVILILLLIAVLSGRSARMRVFDLMSKQREQYKKEVEVVVKANEAKAEKQKSLFEEQQKLEKKIEEDFDIKLESLEKSKKEEIAKLVKEHEHNDNSEELAKLVAETLRAKYVK